MYRDNFKPGLGQTTMEGMRTATAAQTAKTMRSLTETSPQFGGQVSSRIASMDRIKTEGIIANMDQQYRQNQLSNMARTASEISSVKMRSVQAQRDYRIMAETAAGEAIKQGSEIDELDGLTVSGDGWWFNVRSSNTEPLLRLNVEAKDISNMEIVRDSVLSMMVG